MKILLYELNEVPKRLIDYYIKMKPESSFSKISKKGVVLNTITKDSGELHPWSTWPSVHRGVYNNKHNIRYINQDLSNSEKFKPIWEILSNNSIDIGIFGSLQSYPPLKNKSVKFYLPDTFAPSNDAFPKDLKNFQSFNLKMTSENKAISRRIKFNEIKKFLSLFQKGIISKKVIFFTALHLLKEKINPKYKSRRPIIQNVISFDIFYEKIKQHKPSFCTYFTNHVAGMMHRYWKNLFPEDFSLDPKLVDSFHQKSIISAMDLADRNLGNLLNFADRNNYNIWVISSMGQGAIERGEYIPELILRNINKLIIALNLDPKNFELLPAMQPDYCIKCINKNELEKLRKALRKLTFQKDIYVLKERYEPIGTNINIFLERSKSVIKNKTIFFNGKEISIDKFGLEIIIRDKGTGYHIPEGVFIAYGPISNSFEKYKNEIIETSRICPTILKAFNIKKFSYMDSSLV